MNESTEREAALERLESVLGHHFKDRALLETALRHSSFTHEQASGADAHLDNYERLEFLGDAVLALVVANGLYAAKPDWREGELTRALHAIVEGRSLAKLARSLELGGVILLGRTERQSGGHEKPSILENVMEAIVGGIFLDGGLEAVTVFVERVFSDALAADAIVVARDPKTEFQERTVAAVGEFPEYKVVQDSLVEGDEKRFTVEVHLADEPLARGVGRTKRAAERLAATEALAKWQPPKTAEA